MTYQIFYDENKVASRVLEQGFTNGEYNRNEALAAAKYFRHIIGYGDTRVKNNLISFCERNDSFFNYIRNRKQIKSIIRQSKYEFIRSDTVYIRQKEIESIMKIESYKFQVIVLCMLAIVKKTGKASLKTNRWIDVKRSTQMSITNAHMIACIDYCSRKGILDPES